MKKLVLVFALLFAVTIQAQENEAFKKETVEFIKLTGASEVLKKQ